MPKYVSPVLKASMSLYHGRITLRAIAAAPQKTIFWSEGKSLIRSIIFLRAIYAVKIAKHAIVYKS